jgi:hypothetical protein
MIYLLFPSNNEAFRALKDYRTTYNLRTYLLFVQLETTQSTSYSRQKTDETRAQRPTATSKLPQTNHLQTATKLTHLH